MGGSEDQRMSVPLVHSLLSGHERFAVTGASGWLGRTALHLLARALGPQRFRDQVRGFASVAKTVTLRDGTTVVLEPLERLVAMEPAPTHILHFAYLTRDRVAALGLDGYTRSNVAVTGAVVAAIERFHPAGVFCTSSGAVYEPDGGLATDVVTNPYGALKHLEELAIRRATADGGGRSVVTRVFSIAGAYMTKPELYALGDLILQALSGGPMTIRAKGPVERSYCAAADVVAVGVACLLRGGTSNLVFDSGGEIVEVGRLAQLIREEIDPRIAVERDWDPGAAPDRYAGAGRQMATLADQLGLSLQPLRDQIRETAGYLATTTDDDRGGGPSGSPGLVDAGPASPDLARRTGAAPCQGGAGDQRSE